MSQSIETVEGEWKSERHLRENLGSNGPCSETSSKDCRLQVPTEDRSNEVADAEKVETAAQDGTGDAVEHGGDPCYLGLVDSEMW